MADDAASFIAEVEREVQEAVRSLREVERLRPHAWAMLSRVERSATLQFVEDTLARIQNRPSVRVIPDEGLGSGEFGAFDGEHIIVNGRHLLGDVSVIDLIDTVIHEGRHAYQQYAVEHPGLLTDDRVVAIWSDNLDNYLDIEIYGQQLYATQPIEADAWSYAARICEALYDSG